MTSLGATPTDLFPGAAVAAQTAPTVPPDPPQPSSNAAFVGVSPLSLATLVPDHVTAGQGDTTIQMFGLRFETLSNIFLRNLSGAWVPLSATSQAAGRTTFTVPAIYSTTPGFLEISFTGTDSEQTLSLPVADPTLPQLGTAPELTPVSVSLDKTDSQGKPGLTALNANLTSGMKIILGQKRIAALTLPATAIAAGSLTATQPPRLVNIAGDTTFVAILSADGTRLSAPVPLPVFLDEFGFQRSVGRDVSYPLNSAAGFVPGDIEITAVNRNPSLPPNLASSALHDLELQGVGLVEGQTVLFTVLRNGIPSTFLGTLKGVQDITPDGFPMTPAGGSFDPNNPNIKPDLMSGIATMPDAVFAMTDAAVSVSGFDSSGLLVAQSAHAGPSLGPLRIPFGGRVSVALYKDGKGTLYVMTGFEATYSGISNLTIVTDAARIQIQPDPADTTGNPLAQIEFEPAPTPDPPGYFHVRGIGLNRDPLLSNGIPTNKIFVNGVQVRDVSVEYRNFGSLSLPRDIDMLIAHNADIHHVPPQYLKAQAVQESARLTQNFRYELSTIDFAQLSGDVTSFSSWPRIYQAPYCFYALPGTFLFKTDTRILPNPNDDYSTRIENVFQGSSASPTQFQLTAPDVSGNMVAATKLKKMNGPFNFHDPQRSEIWHAGQEALRTELNAAVTAKIVLPTGMQLLTLVRTSQLWRKIGNDSPRRDAQGNITFPAYPNGASQTPAPASIAINEFAVDYATGTVTLSSSQPLLQGQQLVVDFWTAGRTTEPINAGDDCQGLPANNKSVGRFVSGANALDLTGPTIRGDHSFLFAKPGTIPSQTIADLLTKTMTASVNAHSANPQRNHIGVFLSGTDSDKQIEFLTDGSGTPSIPLDPKYSFATAQPYAASTYGIMQLGLSDWDGSARGLVLQSVFNLKDPSAKNFSSILDLNDPKSGDANSLGLGAGFTESSLLGVPANLRCAPLTCSNLKWQMLWATAFRVYNSAEKFYNFSADPAHSLNALVLSGDRCFVPGELSPADTNQKLGSSDVDNPCFVGNQKARTK